MLTDPQLRRSPPRLLRPRPSPATSSISASSSHTRHHPPTLTPPARPSPVSPKRSRVAHRPYPHHPPPKTLEAQLTRPDLQPPRPASRPSAIPRSPSSTTPLGPPQRISPAGRKHPRPRRQPQPHPDSITVSPLPHTQPIADSSYLIPHTSYLIVQKPSSRRSSLN